jgi:hypothetical protein
MENKKYICQWCLADKKKEDLGVIYGKNRFFNKSFFHACKGSHIEKLKGFLEKSDKYYLHNRSSVILGLIIYPVLCLIFSEYFQWITFIMSVDFATGLVFFPYALPELAEKIGVLKMLIVFRATAVLIYIAAALLLLKIV